MKIKARKIIVLLSIWVLSSRSLAVGAEVSVQRIAQANNLFGWSIFTSTQQKAPQTKNIFFSPLSAWLALSLLSNGAEHETLDELKKSLFLSEISLNDANEAIYKLATNLIDHQESGETLRIANAIWTNRNIFKLSPNYTDRVNSYYRLTGEESIARSMPFNQPETLEEINRWVSESTNGMIPSILDELSSDMAAILLNALFFEGQWLHPFSESETVDRPFYKADGTSKTVSMMRQSKKSFLYSENEKFKMVSLAFRSTPEGDSQNYQKGRYQVDLVLPIDRRTKLTSFNQKNYNQLIRQLTPLIIQLEVPKLKFSYKDLLNDELAANGLKRIFSPGLAQLKGLGEEISNRPIYVSKVLQKTALEMDEAGFKAAAVTAIVIVIEAVSAVEGSGKTFIANRPYYLALRDGATGTILFQGIIADPVF